jgi:hypothetical protein
MTIELPRSHGRKVLVEQHTAITLCWLEAKIATPFLTMNVAPLTELTNVATLRSQSLQNNYNRPRQG